MDSLLANYASDDDEEQQQQPPPQQPPSSVIAPQRSELSEPSFSRSSSFFSSLPPPKSSSLFQSLPQPKQSSKPSMPTGFFENDENEDVEEGDSLSTSKLGVDSIKPSSLFSSLPRPKGNPNSSSSSLSTSRFDGDSDGDGNLSKSVSMFSSLPQPNSQKLQKAKSNPSSSESQPKRVVLFKPPFNSSLLKLGEDDDEDDEEEEEIRRRKASQSLFQTPSVTSFLSSIPAPKHSATLGVISSSGSGRRSILETDVPVSSSDDSKVVNDSGSTQKVDHGAENYDSYVNYSSGVEQNVASHRENYDKAAIYNFSTEQNAWNYASYDSYGNYHYSVDQNVVGEAQSVSGASNAGDNGSYENYGNYGDHIQYGSDPAGQPTMVDAENAVRIPEKRRRNDIPSEILEVTQDELIKNRPRQDQVKLTGIAFGPSYQPASSTKGKPSKLQKRKHQITSLYYDMKQKEMELAERRARGLLTKAETQAKYGW